MTLGLGAYMKQLYTLINSFVKSNMEDIVESILSK